MRARMVLAINQGPALGAEPKTTIVIQQIPELVKNLDDWKIPGSLAMNYKVKMLMQDEKFVNEELPNMKADLERRKKNVVKLENLSYRFFEISEMLKPGE